MKYLEGSFSVGANNSDAYRDGWERIFGKPGVVKMHCRVCHEDYDAGSDCVPAGKGCPKKHADLAVTDDPNCKTCSEIWP